MFAAIFMIAWIMKTIETILKREVKPLEILLDKLEPKRTSSY